MCSPEGARSLGGSGSVGSIVGFVVFSRLDNVIRIISALIRGQFRRVSLAIGSLILSAFGRMGKAVCSSLLCYFIGIGRPIGLQIALDRIRIGRAISLLFTLGRTIHTPGVTARQRIATAEATLTSRQGNVNLQLFRGIFHIGSLESAPLVLARGRMPSPWPGTDNG